MLQQQTITPECFGKVTPKRSNARILKGLISLSHEIKDQREDDLRTKYLKAAVAAYESGIYDTWGMNLKKASLNFQRWVAITKTTQEEFTRQIEGNLYFDGDTLLLTIGTVEIWWEGYYFEKHVKSQTITYDEGGVVTQELTMSASEYLQENWKDLAADFILHNLTHAEISDDLIEELI